MNHTKITLAVAAALALSGCGQGSGTPGVSASVENTTGIKSDTKTGIDRSSDQTAGRSSKLTVEGDFSQLLSSAITDVLPATGIKVVPFFNALFHGKLAQPHVLRGAELALNEIGFGPEAGAITDPMRRAAQAEKARLAALVGGNAARNRVAGEKLVCVDLTLAGDYSKARACHESFLIHAYSMHVMQAMRIPQKGHSLDEHTIKSRGNERHFPRAGQLDTLTFALANASRFDAALEKRLADTLTANTFKEGDGARRVVDAVFAIPAAELIAMAQDTAAPNGLTAQVANGELGSELVISVPELSATFTQNEKGVVETRGGAVWNGEGYIMGTKIKIAMERSVDAKLTTKTTESSSVSTDTGTTAKADASISTK